MIYKDYHIQCKVYNKGFILVPISNVKVGDYVRTIKPDTLEYAYSRVKSIVKVTHHRINISTSLMQDIIVCKQSIIFNYAQNKHFYMHQSPTYHDRMVFRSGSDLLTPFILKIKPTLFQDTFYDIVLDNPTDCILVNGYAFLTTSIEG